MIGAGLVPPAKFSKEKPAVYLATSTRPSMLRRAMSSLLKAEMASGTSLMFSSRFRAVTMISVTSRAPASPVESWARAGPGATP